MSGYIYIYIYICIYMPLPSYPRDPSTARTLEMLKRLSF